MDGRFVVQRHKTGRAHYDLRILQDDRVRSWSLLRTPPLRPGEQRLAIEREGAPASELDPPTLEESAFGRGKTRLWDQGGLNIRSASPQRLVLALRGAKMSGTYDMRRMSWYPGNRWLIRKTGT